MTYNRNGLGISELVFLAVNYPVIYETLEKISDVRMMLVIARKAISAINLGLVAR